MTILNNALAAPMLGMLLLTLLVWIYLFVQRIGYSRAHNIDIEKFKT